MFKDRTKLLLAGELERMLEEMPLSKVRVGTLCERCGAQRQVFYYHFKDKYDLIAWIFERDFRQGLADTPPDATQDQIAAALQHMWERRGFYRVAFADKSQNSIERHIQDFDVDLSTRVVGRLLGKAQISDEMFFAIKHFSYGNIGCTIEWLRGELQASPQQLARWEMALMPGFLREAYANYDAELVR